MISKRRFILDLMLVVVAIGVLLVLGTWQVQSLEWKEDLLGRMQAHLTAKPKLMPHVYENPLEYDFVRTIIRGYYLHDKEMYLGPRIFKGQMGYHVITPFRRVSGPVVLVNRGWVPQEKLDPKTRAQGQLPGRVIVNGVMRLPEQEKRMFVPDNKPAQNTWFWLDVPTMLSAVGVEQRFVTPVVLYADNLPEVAWPVGGQLNLNIPNNHLYYAFFWYSMAFVLAVIAVLSYRKNHGK